MSKFDYSKKRYWYHLSDELTQKEVHLIPEERLGRRDSEEPRGARICVAPSIAHCLTAICGNSNLSIYKTKHKIVAKKPRKVFDSSITKEGWITGKYPVSFIKIGKLNLSKYKWRIRFAACEGDTTISVEALAYWQKRLKGKYL